MILDFCVTALLLGSSLFCWAAQGEDVAQLNDLFAPKSEGTGYNVKVDVLETIDSENERVGTTEAPIVTVNPIESEIEWEDLRQHTVAMRTDNKGNSKRSLRLLRIHKSLYSAFWDSSVSHGESVQINELQITNARSNEGSLRRLSEVIGKRPLRLEELAFVIPSELDDFAKYPRKWFSNVQNEGSDDELVEIDSSELPEWSHVFLYGENNFFAITEAVTIFPGPFAGIQVAFRLRYDENDKNQSNSADPSRPDDKSGLSVTDKIMIGVMVAVGVCALTGTTGGIFLVNRKSKRELEKDLELLEEATQYVPADQLRELLESSSGF